nr:FeoC-like transcriptional regulator [Corynebacterium epidermidicanis]
MTPSEQIKSAIRSGCTSRPEIARKTGLSPSTVELVMEHLERSGELVRESLSSCPSSGCGSCTANTGCSGAANPQGRGPVLLQLRKRR